MQCTFKKPFLESTNKCQYSESKWLLSLQIFLSDSGISIQFYDTYVIPLQRKMIHYFMDHNAVESGLFDLGQLHWLNHACLFLQVLIVSDILDPFCV